MKYAAGDSLIFDYYLNLLYVGYFFMESLFQRRDNLKFNGFRSERIALLELAGNSNQNFNINQDIISKTEMLTRKGVYYPKYYRSNLPPRIFNQTLGFQYMGVYSHFSIFEPIPTIKSPDILFYKTSYKCLEIKAIPSVQRFQKGSFSYRVDLNLKQTMDLIQCDYMKNNFVFIDEKFQKRLTVSSKNPDQGLDFDIYDGDKFLDLTLEWKNFQLLKKTLMTAVPYVYGLELTLEENMRIMMRKLENGLIEEQQQKPTIKSPYEPNGDDDNFIL